VTIQARFSDTFNDTTGTSGAPPPLSDSVFRSTDLANPKNSKIASPRQADVVQVARTSTGVDKQDGDRAKSFDPNNEKEFSDFASKELRSQFGLKPDASSKDFVNGYMDAVVGNYRRLPEAQREQVGQLNGLDPTKSYTDPELKDIFTQNLQKYHGIEKGPDQDKQLEGAIVHELFQTNRDILKLQKFRQEDQK
jgi:hypothetical protein